MNDKDLFYLSKEEPNKSCLLALRGLILRQDELVTETTKYGMPCFCYGKKAFVYLWTDKKSGEPYMLFVEGKRLEHPSLASGDRARMKIYKVNPHEDIAKDEIEMILTEALNLFR